MDTSTKRLFPARPLLSIVALGMNSNAYQQNGPMGSRSICAPTGGTFTATHFAGTTVAGRVAKGLGTESQLSSDKQESLTFIDGQLTLITDKGGPILVKYRGRKSSFYGASWRVGASFEADEDGEADWLNDVIAVGTVQVKGNDFHYAFHEILPYEANVDEHALAVAPLYTLNANGAVGERYTVHSPIGGRYFSVSERGAEAKGKLTATSPAGFWWGAHRASRFDGSNQGLPYHVDLTKTFVTPSQGVVFQPYIGTNSRDILANISDVNKRSWVTLAMFEADPTGPEAYLNEILSLGTGRVLDNEVYYEYWILQ